MRLYLIRHGEAASAEADAKRPLTPKGREQAERVARFLRPLGLSVSAVRHSGKLRAAQTAEIVASAVASAGGVREARGLAPMDPVEPLMDEIKRAEGDLMLVGHLPFLGRLVSLLLAGGGGRDLVAFPEAAALCLEGDPEGGWRIAWLVTPETLG